jgi:hypothetical protein
MQKAHFKLVLLNQIRHLTEIGRNRTRHTSFPSCVISKTFGAQNLKLYCRR